MMRLLASDYNSSANAALAEARQAEDHLASIMKRIHGGEWVISVDRVAEFVLIRPQPQPSETASPSRRAV